MGQKLKYLIIHCTATPEGREVSSDEIRHWHLKEKGWKQVGYTDMIHIDGSLENLVPFDQDNEVDPWEITNGAAGLNGVSRHIVYVGGLDKNGKPKDTRTLWQKLAMEIYVKYMTLRHPNIIILGHNEVSGKDCPCFSVRDFLVDIGISGRFIYAINK